MYVLGIDESNHGRVPEVFVGVISKNITVEGRRKSVPLEKFRRNHTTRFYDQASKDDFSYLVFDKQFREHFSDDALQVIGIVELACAFENPLIKLVIDGSLKLFQTDMISEYEPRLRNLECIVEPKADIHYPVVNRADYYANVLYNLYGNIREQKRGRILTSHPWIGERKIKLPFSKAEQKYHYLHTNPDFAKKNTRRPNL